MKEIPLFFSTDDCYLPYMAVALKSIEALASDEYLYRVHVLHTNSICQEYQQQVLEQVKKPNIKVTFDDISKHVEKINKSLYTRDYYTKSTYYRIFIAELYPQYDKALYLDSDIILNEDVANLYNIDIKDNLVGAIVEDVMNNFDVFGTYVEKCFGIKREDYFNAGILLINSKLFRKENIAFKFSELLHKYTFFVTQDEDYLNVLCHDRVHFIEHAWDFAPIPGTLVPLETLKLIHYKMEWKPWLRDNVGYNDIFWYWAEQTTFLEGLKKFKLENNTPESIKQGQKELQVLMDRAVQDGNDPMNYYNQEFKNRGLKPDGNN